MSAVSNWAVEDLCAAAWPALEEQAVAGWVLKYAAGVSRRCNSANPTPQALADLSAIAETGEAFYRARDLPCRFRLLSFQSMAFDEALIERGYSKESETRTLCAPEWAVFVSSHRTSVEAAATPAWIAGVTAAQDRGERDSQTYAKIVARLAVPCAFAVTRNPAGEAASWAYGAIKDKRLCIESVATRADQRGHGFAGETVGALMAWGGRQGARAGFLQVQTDNEAAVRLYKRLGFHHELYRYHYRTLQMRGA